MDFLKRNTAVRHITFPEAKSSADGASFNSDISVSANRGIITTAKHITDYISGFDIHIGVTCDLCDIGISFITIATTENIHISDSVVTLNNDTGIANRLGFVATTIHAALDIGARESCCRLMVTYKLIRHCSGVIANVDMWVGGNGGGLTFTAAKHITLNTLFLFNVDNINLR